MPSPALRDVELAERMLASFTVQAAPLYVTTIPVAPVSKARARFGRSGHAYKTSASKNDEEVTAWYIRRLIKAPLTGNVAIACVFFRPNRQRLDVDNMLKHVCDSANGIAWLDDSQVTAMAAIAEYDPARPRTVVMIAKHISTLTRDRGSERTCEHCGQTFILNTAKPQRICSAACRNEWQKGRNRQRGQPPTPCITCGAPTSKPSVQRCRKCWLNRATEGNPA